MTGNTDMHLLVTYTFKKGRDVDQKTSQYLVWSPFSSCIATHRLCIELIRLLIVASGMLSHSSSRAVRSCWILVGTETQSSKRRSRASQTCSIRDISGEYAGHERTWAFSASRNCVQILATWGCALSCWNMRWWQRIKGDGRGQRASWSHHGISVHWNCHW